MADKKDIERIVYEMTSVTIKGIETMGRNKVRIIFIDDSSLYFHKENDTYDLEVYFVEPQIVRARKE